MQGLKLDPLAMQKPDIHVKMPTLPRAAPAGEISPPILIAIQGKGYFLYILGIVLKGLYFRIVILWLVRVQFCFVCACDIARDIAQV